MHILHFLHESVMPMEAQMTQGVQSSICTPLRPASAEAASPSESPRHFAAKG